MIVVDASALLALVADPDRHPAFVAAIDERPLAAPDHLHVEVTSAVRRQVLRGATPRQAGRSIVNDAMEFPISLWPFADLVADVWALRDALTAFDAAYLVLARHLDAEVITLDGGLAVRAASENRLRAGPG